MAIEKNNIRAARFNSEFSPVSRETIVSSDEDEFQRRSLAVDSGNDDDDDEFDDADSGAGSDDFDLLELGETGAEFCQVGNLTCSVPFELYDLPGLEEILSLDVWNEYLSEEERFSLTKFLPDMDQDTFMRTLNDLFKGNNFHFGSPIKKLFDMLKGGLCEPRVALYREGLGFFQKRQHYHHLRKHQNNMVLNICQIRDAWVNCKAYNIEERLRVLNIMKTLKGLTVEKMEDDGFEFSERDDMSDMLRSKRIKDQNTVQKLGDFSGYGVHPNLDFVSGGQPMGFESAKHRKQNPKGILKTGGSKIPSAKEFGGRFFPGFDMNSEPHDLVGSLARQKYDSGAALRAWDRKMLDDDAEDPMFGTGIQRDWNAMRDSAMSKSGSLRAGKGKKYDLLRREELASDGFMALPPKNDLRTYGRNKDVNQLSEGKLLSAELPNMRTSYDVAKKSKYAENYQQFSARDHIKSMKGHTPPFPLKGSRAELSEHAEMFWPYKNERDDFLVDPSVRYDDWNIRSKKRKTGRVSPDLPFRSYKASSPHMNDGFMHFDGRIKATQEKVRGNYVQNGGTIMAASKGNRAFTRNEETESDSSEQFDGDEDSNALIRRKLAYPSVVMEGNRLSSLKSGTDSRKAKALKKSTMDDAWALEGTARMPKRGFVDNVHMSGVESYYLKAKQKGMVNESSPLHKSASRILDEVDSKPDYKLGRNGHLGAEAGDRLQIRSSRAYHAGKRHKVEAAYEHAMSRSNYLHNYLVEDDASLVTFPLADEKNMARTGKKGQSFEEYNHREKSEASLIGCNTVSKKRKGKEYAADVKRRGEDVNLQSNLPHQTDDSPFLKKKGKRKVEIDAAISEMEVSEPQAAEMGATDFEMEIKPPKRRFTLITPTVHTGFSFSIIHLLSAVRMAMISPLAEDSLDFGKPGDEQNGKQEGDVNENAVTAGLDHPLQASFPSQTVHEIVNRVTVSPGDPCILETQEPLQDLVRGVLKIFSSKTAPLGAKGWKSLVSYEKSKKSWSWVGPVNNSSNDHETVEEVTSPEAWGLPHKMLVKLVDSFANWLKNGQETLQQIGSLPAPPLELMQVNLDEKERFRDLRAQKSLNTISPSSEEVRAYFRKEELLRYSIPDRAFSYTSADGKKSIVAPLRRGGGKPASKARDHFMLKPDRPAHVTILCLVRDAASRLPGSIGTRADVCTLIRDSQYIVENVTDTQVNQVVSGALDRLHYERDPCVQFDGERKLWVYLHREREEEDFEDDGTSSTKKWKRQKKDPAEQSEGAVTVAFHGTGDQSGYDLASDLNVDPASVDDNKQMEMDCHDGKNAEDNADTDHEPEQGNTQQGQPTGWEPPHLNPEQEKNLLCQENSTIEDFNEEGFGGERLVGPLSG